MPTYVAQRNFRGSNVGGNWLFYSGDELDLDVDTALWIEEEQPGTLLPAPKKKSKKKPQEAGD